MQAQRQLGNILCCSVLDGIPEGGSDPMMGGSVGCIYSRVLPFLPYSTLEWKLEVFGLWA